MNILLIHSSAEKRESVTFALEGELELHVTATSNADAALNELDKSEANAKALSILDSAQSNEKARKILEENASFPMIVVEEELFDPAIKERKSSDGQPIKIIAVVNKEPEAIAELFKKGFDDYVLDKTLEQDLVNIIQEIDSQIVEDARDRLYIPIETKILVRLSPLDHDIFIRLSQAKYVKIYKSGDKFEAEDYEKWHVEKRIQRLYIKKESFAAIMSLLNSRIDEIIEDENVDQKTAEEFAKGTQETIHEMILRTGFTPEMVDLAHKNVELTKKVIGKNPKLQSIIDKIQSQEEEYISGHSLLLAEISCAISVNLSWTSDTTFTKLTIAALFHDITVKNQEIAKIQTLEELDKVRDKFTTEEIDNYMKHPMEAADIVKQFREIPQEVDSVIMHHHERPDSSGFPRKLGNQYIPQLSALFIVSHEIVNDIIAQKKNFSMAKCFNRLKGKYSSGNFRSIIKTIDPEANEDASND